MAAQDSIIAYLKKHGSAGSKELCEHLGISRQALNRHLRHLIDDGDVLRTGTTRNARYHHPSSSPAPEVYKGNFTVTGLEEGKTYERLALSLNLRSALRKNAEVISHYAITEILNNAIEHSNSTTVKIRAALKVDRLTIDIKDTGIGVFASIAQKLGYDDEHDAMVQMIKGKTTTMPGAHSGEGIFFTSKAVDRFVLRSHRIQLEWHRKYEDVFVANRRFVKGTDARIEVRRDTRTILEEVFSEFAPEEFDYRFTKTRVQVKLLGNEYISRSEAKRLLLNLDKFKIVELDFRNVESIGQGFADEVFRVFTAAHPEIKVEAHNTGRAAEAMIRHVAGAPVKN